ncbi:MAG TPA: cache domain-containing protein, partial [Feifaniaceae bacterium]|nr:cache domain-containing protein [Feifaniaceae bacterium]
MMRKLYIKLPFQLAIFLLIIVIIVLSFAQTSLTSSLTEQAHEDITTLATNNAQLARDYFEAMQMQSSTLAMMFSKMEADVKGTSDSSTYVIPIIRSVLYGALEDERIYGAYAAFEPNKYFPYTPEGISFHAYRDGDAVKLETKYNYNEYGTADYYFNSVDTKRPYITEPYDYERARFAYEGDDGRNVSLVSISNPIFNGDGECVGVANCEIAVDTINDLNFDMGGLDSAYQFILTGDKHYIAHSSRPDLMGSAYKTTDEVNSAEMISAATGKNAILTEGKSATTGKDSLVVLMPTTITGIQKHFVSAFVVDKEETLASLNSTLGLLRLGLIGFVLVFMVLFSFLMRRALSPVGKIVQFSMDVQNGNLDTNIKLKSHDELMDLYNAVDGIRNTIRTLVSDSIKLTEAAVQGNLEERADAEQHKGEYKRLVEGINGTLDAIVEPVVEIIDMLQQLQRGNLGVRIEKDYQGEFALIRDSFNETMDALNRYIGDVARILKAVSEGDLSEEITSEFHGDFVTLKDSINNIIASLNDTLANINIAADQVASGTRQVSGGSQSISQGATEQASAIEELTATITEIAAQTKENAKAANRANELSIAAKEEAYKGTGHM